MESVLTETSSSDRKPEKSYTGMEISDGMSSVKKKSDPMLNTLSPNKVLSFVFDFNQTVGLDWYMYYLAAIYLRGENLPAFSKFEMFNLRNHSFLGAIIWYTYGVCTAMRTSSSMTTEQQQDYDD
jgi:hypothetical protein